MQTKIIKATQATVNCVGKDVDGKPTTYTSVKFSTADGRPEPRPRIILPDTEGQYWYWTPDDAAPEP